MEHLWSQAGATGGNHGNGFGAHGKEGVNGISLTRIADS